jgi:uncharacterized phiE125 gp8 family phage protein
MYSVKVKTAVTTELVSLADAKSHLRIDSSDEDTLLTALVAQCIRRIENYCSVSIGAQTRIWTYDSDGDEEEIPYGPITSITSAKLLTDATTVPVTYDTYEEGDYWCTDGEDFKTFEPFATGRWKLEYVCGYTSATLPADLKLAILHEIAYRYENRGDKGKQYAVEVVGVCESAKIFAAPYRRVLL